MSGDGFVFDAPAHPRWLPLPLEGDVDQEAAALVQRVAGHSASPDFLETTTAWVAGTTRVVRREVQRVREERLRPTFAAWVLLPEPDLLLPGPVAFLRAGPLGRDDDADAALGSVVDLVAELHGPLEVEGLETASGPALQVRRRPVRTVDGDRLVEEQRLVLWARPDLEVVVHLSLYAVDLVEGGRAAAPLRELGASLRWDVV
ncbi:MAG: hypothetical protein JWN08_3590 [Frankiales bacterium]|nr:hypothetical protein [Frankiales bacterium]